MRTNQFRLLWVALLSLSGVLPAAATDYEAADYLPLAVGDSWTYEHFYFENDAPYILGVGYYPQWPTYRAQWPEEPQFTITVERTEVIDGKTYYVINDMPTGWPPAPPHFIAGKKLRWEGTHLMERTADGEQAIYRFDGANETGYEIPTDEGSNRVTVRFRSESVPTYWFRFHGNFSGGRGLGFLAGYGLRRGGWWISGEDYPLFCNEVIPLHAVLGGRTVQYEDALTHTNVSSSSWGQVKQSLLVNSMEERADR
ncbi:MAG: hypothetical protein F4X75_25125 [Gemmatimonadetes bacterium]|nr:hypothetical protein [Gemmatimonadota bacterium]